MARSLVIALAALAATTLAGCQDEAPMDRSNESIVGTIQAAEGRAFDVVIPLWLSPDGATAGQWMAALGTRGNVTAELVETPRGLGIAFAGNGTVTFEVQDVRTPPGPDGRARAYLEGAVSLQSDGRPVVISRAGPADITWRYEGTSDGGCFITIFGYAETAEPGTYPLTGATRPDRAHDCVE